MAEMLDIIGLPESTETADVTKFGLKTIDKPEEAAKLSPGTEFLDPTGKKRVVPFKAKTPAEAESLPEGAEFLDPSGKLRKTPTYQGLDFTAQTLYNMAATDKEREKALERSYPGKVKRREHTKDLYVEDEGGVLRRSKGVMEAPGAFAASQAAPVLGSIAGEVGGGIAGAVGGPPGIYGGALAGGAVGGAAGQAFNDSILTLAGIYDRSAGQEAYELALSGTAGAVGTAIGRGIAATAPVIKDTAKRVLPKVANWVAGTDPEALRTGIKLREQGVLVPPSPMFPELPHVINVVEVFDPAFHTQKPLLQSATDYYERTGSDLLKSKEIGVEKPGKITDPAAAVSTKKAGEAILGRTRAELAHADEQLRVALEWHRAGAQMGATQRGTLMETLRAADKEARAAADKVIGEGFNHIQGDIDKAMKVAKAGYNSGDLWNSVGKKLQAIKLGISQRAKMRYDQADELAGGHLPNISGLPEMAEHMLAQMPEGFEGKYPGIIKQIRDIAGVPELDKEGVPTGNWIKPPINPTFGQLHNLRTVLRNNVNYYDLTPDFREGAMKFFANRVNEALHPEALPRLPEGFTVKTYPVEAGFMGAKTSRGVDIFDPQGRRVLEATLNKYGDGYQLNHIVNDSKWLSESNAEFPRYKNLGETAYLEAAKLAQAEGKKLYIGASGETSRFAKAIHERLLTKGLAKTTEYPGVLEVIPKDTGPLQAAAKFLDETDKWYGKVMKPLTDKNIQAVVSGLESGLPADPKKLYDVLIREGRTELTNKVRKMVGPNLWAGIKAADIKEMLDNAKTLMPGEIDGKQFAKQVLDRYRTGMLEAVHGKEATRLMEQARRIEMLEGRLPVRIAPGDPVSSIISKARETAEAAKKAAQQDPLGTLNKEMKLIQRDQAREAAKMRAKQQTDPLAFLYKPPFKATEAVDKILGSEDLILAAAAKFGEQSPEFNLLRQVWAERILTGTLQPSERMGKVSEEVQRIMFPGASLSAMRELAKNMDFLMHARPAGAGVSMAATAKVEHPFGFLPGGKAAGKALNIVTLGFGEPVARGLIGGYFKMIRNFVNKPGFLRWMEKGLQGDERAREMVKAEIQRIMQKGGAVGAGAAQGLAQAPNQTLPFSSVSQQATQ